jgi:methionyl aminopeptidase
MSIESAVDLDGMTCAGRVVAEALDAMVRTTQIGMSTGDLDAVGAAVLKSYGSTSAPQAIYGCPTVTLISVNNEIVHGLPGARILRAGDVVKLDVTAETDGYIADAATTVVLPGASDSSQQLRHAAISAFDAGCRAARAGRPVSAIGRAVEHEVSARGFHVLRELSGHGVGRAIHESPTVPNYFDPFQKDVLTEGLVITIEPLISERPTGVIAGEDGWTLRTRNGCLAAHHEHTMIITNSEPIIVTLR